MTIDVDQESLLATMVCIAIVWLTIEFVDWFG